MSTTFHGTEALLAGKTDNTVAFTDADQVQDATITQEGNVVEVHALGARAPQEIKAGKIVTELSFTRKWESGNFSAIGATLQAAFEAGTSTLFFALFPQGDASPKILLNTCTVSSWSVQTDIDNVMNEIVTIKALSVDIS